MSTPAMLLPRRLSLALSRRSLASTASRLALEEHGRTTAHGDHTAPLTIPRDGVERQAIAMAQHEGDLGTVREDMFNNSHDYSRWRYGALAGGFLLLLAYQEFLIDDKRFPVTGYDIDRAEEWDKSLEGYSLYRTFRDLLVRSAQDPVERIAVQADQLVDDLHSARVTKTWNYYEKPAARYSYSATRPFTGMIGHVPASFPVSGDDLRVRTEQAWVHRPPSEAEEKQAEESAEGGDEGEEKAEKGDDGDDSE